MCVLERKHLRVSHLTGKTHNFCSPRMYTVNTAMFHNLLHVKVTATTSSWRTYGVKLSLESSLHNNFLRRYQPNVAAARPERLPNSQNHSTVTPQPMI